MHRAFLLLLLSAVLGATSAATACEPLDAPKLTLKLRIDAGSTPSPRRVPRSELHAEAGELSSSGDTEVVGLTTAAIETEAKTNFNVVEDVAGTCAVLTLVDVRVRLRQRILLDESLGRGSCAEKAALEHEKLHVAYNREAMTRGRERLRSTLDATLDAVRGRWMPQGELEAWLERTLQPAVQAEVTRIEADADQHHRAIDTPESYRRTFAHCD